MDKDGGLSLETQRKLFYVSGFLVLFTGIWAIFDSHKELSYFKNNCIETEARVVDVTSKGVNIRDKDELKAGKKFVRARSYSHTVYIRLKLQGSNYFQNKETILYCDGFKKTRGQSITVYYHPDDHSINLWGGLEGYFSRTFWPYGLIVWGIGQIAFLIYMDKTGNYITSETFEEHKKAFYDK